MSNEHKKITDSRESKSIKKHTISRKIIRAFYKKETQKELEQSIIDELINNLHGPVCRICEDNFAPYDHTICNDCSSAMDRLKK